MIPEIEEQLKSEYIDEHYDHQEFLKFKKKEKLTYSDANERWSRYLGGDAWAHARELLSNNKLELKGIRLIEIDKEIQKCTCASKLIYPDNREVDVTYSAQITTAEDIYVEVFYEEF